MLIRVLANLDCRAQAMQMCFEKDLHESLKAQEEILKLRFRIKELEAQLRSRQLATENSANGGVSTQQQSQQHFHMATIDTQKENVFQQQIQDLEKRIDDMQQANAACEKRANDLQDEIDKLLKHEHDLGVAKTAWENHSKAWEHQAKGLEQEKTRLQTQVLELEQKVTILKSDYSDLFKDAEGISDERDKVRDTFTKLQNEARGFKRRFNISGKELSDAQKLHVRRFDVSGADVDSCQRLGNH